MHAPQVLLIQTSGLLQSELPQQFPAKQEPAQHFSPVAPHWESSVHAVQVLPEQTWAPQSLLLQQLPATHEPAQHFWPLAAHCESSEQAPHE